MINRSTGSRLEIIMQDEVTMYCLILVPLNGRNSSKFGNNLNDSKFYSRRN